MSKPRISIAVPIHDMANGDYFLQRLKDSLYKQTFQDFELVITKEGKMAENTNAAIKQCSGDIIKILYMDDFLANPFALQHITHNFKGGWMATGCTHTEDGTTFFNDHVPTWNDDMESGNNTIGSPSVIAFENNDPLLFDENLSWMLDVELYGRLYKRYGLPRLINMIDIGIGIGPHQMTNILTDEEKLQEVKYLHGKTN